MKIALCLSGEFRSPHKADLIIGSWVDSIINPLDPDIFIATTNYSEHAKELDNTVFFDTLKKFNINPKKVYCEPDCKVDIKYNDYFKYYTANKWITTTKQQAFYMQKANELSKEYEQENNFVYDWIIRSRMDLIFLSQIADLYFYNPNNIYLLSRYCTKNKTKEWMLDDGFAFGGRKAIDIYSDKIYQYNNVEPTFIKESDYCTEVVMETILKHFGIKIVELYRPNFTNQRYLQNDAILPKGGVNLKANNNFKCRYFI